jgi:hypothetical protein
MQHDVVSDFDLTKGMPKGAAMRALDSEIANEGAKVVGRGEEIILSNGDRVAWTPPPEKLVIPDLSNTKSLRHYFGQRGHQVYPAWLYHPTKDAILVKDAAEAAKVGIVFRQATNDERNRYGLKEVWDWEDGCEWRPNPYRVEAFDPHGPASGQKNLISKAPDPGVSQHQLVAALIPSVAAAVAQALKADGPGKPANIDAAQWEQFIAFQAWQKTSEAVSTIAQTVTDDPDSGKRDDIANGASADLLGNALTPEQDHVLWEAEATRLGVKIDKRWGTDRLKEEVAKASTDPA